MGVYLITGEERFLVQQKEAELKNAALPDLSLADMNYSYYKENFDIAMLLNDCDMPPFMAEKRLICVHDSGLFVTGRKDDTTAVAKYIENLPDTTVLIFNETDTHGNNALSKAVKKYGEVFNFKRMKPYELVNYIKKKCPVKIPAEYFVACVGDDMERLNGELDKLLTFTKGKDITEADIDEACSKTPEMNIFKMMDAIGGKDTAAAISVYNNMLAAKDSPFRVLKMLVRQLKLMLECKFLSEKGMAPKQIADELGLLEMHARGYLEQSRNFKKVDLFNGLNACYKCDNDIKTGRIDDELGVELIILSLGK